MKDQMNGENIKSVLSNITMPKGFYIREFEENDFPYIQKIYENEGWLTIVNRPNDGLKAFKNSDIALVAIYEDKVVGVVRGLTDTEITTYIVELIINEEFRGKGLGKSLINACHLLYPRTRIEVLGSSYSKDFYRANEFREFFGFRKSF